MPRNTALILGTSGIVGRALLEHLEHEADWDVIGIARRPPELATRARLLSVDLLDRAACEAAFAAMPQVTHVFNAAFRQCARYEDEIVPNLEMVRNVVEPLERVAANLQHVQLVQGSKWYGNHHGPYPTPAREDQPRHPSPHFYFAQRRWLAERQQGKAWSWSTLRPHGIWGFAIGSQLNMMNAVAIYATIMKHEGHALHYPGKPGAFDALYQCTEAAHLAKGMVWAATAPAARNQDFNMVNGDYIRWRHAWPVVARWFDMPVGEILRIDMERLMADREADWAEIVRTYGLKPWRMSDLTTWEVAATNMFNADWDQMSAMTKANRAGWTAVNDTYEMIPRQLDRLAAEGVIPDFRR